MAKSRLNKQTKTEEIELTPEKVRKLNEAFRNSQRPNRTNNKALQKPLSKSPNRKRNN